MLPERESLRALPSVDEVLGRLNGLPYPRALIVGEIRRALDDARARLRSGIAADAETSEAPIEKKIEEALSRLVQPPLRPVVNATGVILHTNLGRAPLGTFAPVSGYSNLEYDLGTGKRGKRDTHLAALCDRLFGFPAIGVNNNAAAVYLALHELAAGGEVVVSRGELIEIGDGFRIPDIMGHSGAVLREIGTTNRTSIADYRNALTGQTRLILRVHPSNFRITGFTARPALEDLVALGRETGIPVYEDLGSGCALDLGEYGIDEPLVQSSLRAGVDLVSFSGDKLLGGPQAGLLVGRGELITRLRRNPMFRALRLDKIIIEALASTLRSLLLERWEQIPAIAMARLSKEDIRVRAEALIANCPDLDAEVIDGESVIGGGSTPEQSIPTCLIAIHTADATAFERTLRANDPPVICRIDRDQVLLDLRTVFPAEDATIVTALKAALSQV
jgi:L-seryl-tRNA(Ser) seleniumtransferase